MQFKKFQYVVLAILLSSFLSAMYYWKEVGGFLISKGFFNFYPESAAQKRLSTELDQALQKLNTTYAKEPQKFAWLPSYANACKTATPSVSHASCLTLVVERSTMQEAVSASFAVQKSIVSLGPGPDSRFAGTHVLILPVTRNADYTGEITPYAISKNFSVGTNIFFKIGS